MSEAEAEELDWITIGWNSIIFKIPKGYNHQLVKETKVLIEQAKKEGRDGVIREILDKISLEEGTQEIYGDIEVFDTPLDRIKKWLKEWESFRRNK